VNALQIIAAMTDVIGRATSAHDIYDAALDGFQQGLGVERGSILLFDPDGVMRFKACRGLSSEYRAAVEGHTPWTRGVRAAEPILVGDIEEDRSVAEYRPIFRRERIRALAFIPLIGDAGLIGKFMVYYARPHVFSGDEVRFALTLARLVAFALGRFTLLDAERRLHSEAERAERRLRDLVRSVPGVVWEAWGQPDEVSQRIDFVSDYVETMLGYSVDEWLRTPNFWLTIVHPHDQERAGREAAAIFASGRPGVSEFRWVAKDGRVLWVEAQSTVILDPEGRVIGMRGVTMDISARKAAEAERLDLLAREQAARAEARRQAMFRALIESAPDAMITADQAGRIVLVNSRAEQLFGYQREELVGRDVESLLPEALRAAHVRHRAEYHRNPQTRPMGIGLDLSARRKDGIGFPAEISLSPLQTEDGLLITAVVRDVTERRRQEEARRELLRQQVGRAEAERRRERSEFLSQVSSLLGATLDHQTTLREVAQLAVPFLADWCLVDVLTEQEEIERVAAAHVDPREASLLTRAPGQYPAGWVFPGLLVEALRTGHTTAVNDPGLMAMPGAGLETPPDRPRALLQPTALVIAPLVARGRVLGALSCIVAESGRRYGEDDVRLIEEVARRAALAVDNARLYRQAQQANRVKDEFLAMLSHELRTPLNAILGWAHILQSRSGDEPGVRRAAAIIARNVDVQTRLISDLLDISRIVSGKLDLMRREFDVAGVVEAAIETVRPAAAAKGVDICQSAPARRPLVYGDPHRLQQAVWNLLSNAVKFTPEAGRVDVVIEPEPQGLRIRVTDTGIGIAADSLPFVFDRFWQGDTSTTRAHGGLGLGLAIARYVVELHGGTVSASSEGEGRGSTFVIVLPESHAPTGPGPDEAGLIGRVKPERTRQPAG
jgi:PAS domain S-box-containing protein